MHIRAGQYELNRNAPKPKAAAEWSKFLDIGLEFKYIKRADGSEELDINFHCC